MAEELQATEVLQRSRNEGICAISVRGYKSLANEGRIEVRPLTILAGANSSGKSSIMQPLLLMKQTLEASIDPGPLLLNGPNVRFTSVNEFVSRRRNMDNTFSFEIETPKQVRHKITFLVENDQSLAIRDMITEVMGERSLHLAPGQESNYLVQALAEFFPRSRREYWERDGFKLVVSRDRCFLSVAYTLQYETDDYAPLPIPSGESYFPLPHVLPFVELRRLLHVPGHRGSPQRVYEKTAADRVFPGTFERHTATIIAGWQRHRDPRLQQLEHGLGDLGLTSEVWAQLVDDTQVELRIGRLPDTRTAGADLVNIADVGFGVSQVLPVLVALLVAEEGQLVYVEQPELHLHPRAQYGLARVMAQAAKRGAKLVVETHSSLFLLQIRTLIANGDIDPGLVKLHWFSRDPSDGTTLIRSADLDTVGTFGDWPEDFGDVEMLAEGAYLDAVESGTEDNGTTAQ
jgi:hypothetical protein